MPRDMPPSTRKIAIMAIGGSFTTVRGVEIPVWTCMGVRDNIPEAADFIAQLCPSPEYVAVNRFTLMEVPDGGH